MLMMNGNKIQHEDYCSLCTNVEHRKKRGSSHTLADSLVKGQEMEDDGKKRWKVVSKVVSAATGNSKGPWLNSKLHVVAFDCSKYPTYDVAKTKPDGLLVLAILIKAEKGKHNPAYEHFLHHLSKIRHVGQSTNLTSLNLKGMMPPNTVNMFTYNGSLTTPPCTQNVRWMIFANLATISTNQLEKLQDTLLGHNGQPLTSNVRKTKPLKNRKVIANFQPEGKEHSKGIKNCFQKKKAP
ncbi:carbonic anhydrase 6 [Monodelphis domestica]|uniref:carbonic anhydrase 6 n=1 Tax=Monodelphis domestica TaxID=13616 RepID=UPI0024E1EC85|nr:carbonic anhydrase 6 [Monodelphis domestica]